MSSLTEEYAAHANEAALRPRFSGRSVLVTGAGSGFGLAVARRIAAEGGRVVAVDRNATKLAATLHDLPAAESGPHHSITMDLRQTEAAQAVVHEALKHVAYLDVLVNSAGVCHFRKMPDITPAEWDEVFEIDVRSLFLLSVAFAEAANPQRGARIVNLGSNAGRKGRALSAHYAAAKAAVANLTESLALAYGPKNVTANTVCPAVVLTPLWETNFAELGAITGKTAEELCAGWRALTPLRRLATIDDVVNLITFLASDEAAFITGQAINVCGGFMLTC